MRTVLEDDNVDMGMVILTPQSMTDIGAIVDTLLRLSEMVCNHPEISELDINPLIVHAQGQGCSVADSRVMLRRP